MWLRPRNVRGGRPAPGTGRARQVPPCRLRGSTALPTPRPRRLAPRTPRQCTSVASSHLACGSDMRALGLSLCGRFRNNALYSSLSLRREIQIPYHVLRGLRVWLLPSLQPCLFLLWPPHGTTSQLLEPVKTFRHQACALAAPVAWRVL